MSDLADNKMTGFSDIFKYRVKNEEGNIRKMCIKDIIERRADESPEVTFVKANGTAYTWGDINWGVKYWSQTPDFLKHLDYFRKREGRSKNAVNYSGSPKHLLLRG